MRKGVIFILFALWSAACSSASQTTATVGESVCTGRMLEKIRRMEQDLFPGTEGPLRHNKSGMNLLHLVARSGHLETAKCLVAQKYPIDGQDKRGNTPLHYALLNGHEELARFLIEKGADVTIKNKKQQGMIHMAVLSMPGTSRTVPSVDPLRGRISSLFGLRFHPIRRKYHFHHGIDIAAPPGKKIVAAGHGKVMRFRYKQSIGKVIVLQHTNNFKTIYGHCRGLGKLRMGRSIERGYTVGKVGSTGNSTGPHLHYEIVYDGLTINPYHYLRAVSKGYSVNGIIALLKEKGTGINERDRTGRAPVHYAANRGIPAIKALVRSGAWINMYDSKGLTPLHYAAFSSVATARYLLQCKARVNAKTKSMYKNKGRYYPRGSTPLKIALKNEWLQMAKLFMRYGGR